MIPHRRPACCVCVCFGGKEEGGIELATIEWKVGKELGNRLLGEGLGSRDVLSLRELGYGELGAGGKGC